MDYVALRQELQQDPMQLGYAPLVQVNNCIGLAQMMNQTRTGCTKYVPVLTGSLLLKWAATGPLAILSDYAVNANNLVQLRACCMAALKVLDGVASLDLSDNTVTSMLQNLVQAGVLAQPYQQSLLALATQSPASRAEMLFGQDVTYTDIQQALRN